MHDTQMHVPTKPIYQGIDTDGDIADGEGEVGGRGGVNDDDNGDLGLPGVCECVLRVIQRALLEKSQCSPYCNNWMFLSNKEKCTIRNKWETNEIFFSDSMKQNMKGSIEETITILYDFSYFIINKTKFDCFFSYSVSNERMFLIE